MKTSELKAKLEALNTSQLKKLAELSDVSLRTLWKIRAGEIITAGEPIKEKLTQGFRRMPRKLLGKERG